MRRTARNRVLSYVAAFVLAISMAGCGGSSKEDRVQPHATKNLNAVNEHTKKRRTAKVDAILEKLGAPQEHHEHAGDTRAE